MKKRPAKRTASVIFLGRSDALVAVRKMVVEHGFAVVDVPGRGVEWAVVDDDVWAGRRTRSQEAILRRLSAFRVPCLLPNEAAAWLSGMASKPRLTPL
ncbi:hypothetical protein G3I59_27380 [Amycolatopsis rubida]|uniref:Uncharacterized protein n=1 Tax=Amycolatopsis rubida TaxID=112413 RepID=A0ABX0BZF4_9PSEU|nr:MULTISPECIES: hypothetical protein [Amycolatopsis]MYW94219.1 hypothetical protein [Amycolatopsis rubida]NEC59208.1 hypothetical protein [Amycolatopsis rubida]